MGWTQEGRNFSEARESIRREFIQRLLDISESPDGLWMMLEWTDGPLIVFARIDDRGYVKLMDETVGPNYYDVPLEWLDRAPAQAGSYSAGWRERVRNNGKLI